MIDESLCFRAEVKVVFFGHIKTVKNLYTYQLVNLYISTYPLFFAFSQYEITFNQSYR